MMKGKVESEYPMLDS